MLAAVYASQPQMPHQAQTDPPAQQTSAPAGPLSAAGADVAARLQRIEALAAEIARAQVHATLTNSGSAEEPAKTLSCPLQQSLTSVLGALIYLWADQSHPLVML